MSENKTQPTLVSVDDFIASVENYRRKADTQTLLKIYEEITGLPPVMWGSSIIGFGTYHYKYDSGREGDSPIAAFSPRKANITLYVGDKFENAQQYYAKLGKHKKSIACLYINKLDDINIEVLREIISKDYNKTLEAAD